MQTRYYVGINFILDTKQIRFHNFFIVLWMTEAELAYRMVTVSITKTIQCKSQIYMSSHTIYCSLSVEYKNDSANERINSEIFPLTALNFQFVMKEKVNVYVEPLCI